MMLKIKKKDNKDFKKLSSSKNYLILELAGLTFSQKLAVIQKEEG